MRSPRSRSLLFLLLLASCGLGQDPLQGTAPLSMEGDLASTMIDGIDRFLLRKLDEAAVARGRGALPPEAARRRTLRAMLGLNETTRAAPRGIQMELQATTERGAVLADTASLRVLRVRWPSGDRGSWPGLLLQPKGQVRASVVAIPDAEQSCEWLAGSGYARHLASQGCQVIIPHIVSRKVQARRRSQLTDREFLYRSAFELGRGLTGYELEAIHGALTWLKAQAEAPVGLVGWGEGGRLALLGAALWPEVNAACVSGYFGSRTGMWNEPLDRNVFGLLNQFGDAELAALVGQRPLIVDAMPGPTANVRTRGGAPYALTAQQPADIEAEIARARKRAANVTLIGRSASTQTVSTGAVRNFAKHLGIGSLSFDTGPIELEEDALRAERLVQQLDRRNQRLLEVSAERRKAFFKDLDTGSLEKFQATIEPYRETFRTETIGAFQQPRLPASPRSRQVYDTAHFRGYEVVLDVFPDVFAFGILLVPKSIDAGERRPVVVCQHGLEGRPRNVIEQNHAAYHDYAAKLTERGFVTFSPQNIYIFQDRFRTLQRKANPLGKTLFSIMVPQHAQITDWLAALPFVDPDRIAFYGLSYGGKSAMRIPPLVERYCLSICSADFNDWVWKNASTTTPYSYVWSGEYEIFEWNLGGTFNYAEMAALIAPRPFMVERGHFDGVAPDERVAYEFAKVRHLYQAQLGIGDLCEIEFFVGPHTINGKGTFDFLHRHLKWPQKK